MTRLVDDLDATVAVACAALRTVLDADWSVPATGLTWSCRGTVEHTADDLFAYAAQLSVATPQLESYVPMSTHARRPGEPGNTVHAADAAGPAGVVEVLDACGGLLSAVTRTRSPDTRGWHPSGVADPDGFAAMGTVEVLLHLYDVAEPLGLTWDPDPAVVRRVLERLFPDESRDESPWPTLLAATGRAGSDRTSWRWDGSVRDPVGNETA